MLNRFIKALLIAFGLAGISILLLSLFGFGYLHTFECNRFEPPTYKGKCELTSQGIFGTKKVSFPIVSLQDAVIKEFIHITEGSTSTYRVEIVTNKEVFPLSKTYTAVRYGKANKVKKIRNFINNRTQKFLSVKHDERWIFIIIVLFVVCGAWVLSGV